MSQKQISERGKALVIRNAINANFSELYGDNNGNFIFAGGEGDPPGLTQLIQPNTWTPVTWDVLPVNNTAAVLEDDLATWSRDGNDERAMGLFASIFTAAFENTNAGLTVPHRRRLRVSVAPQSTGVYATIHEDDFLFHPDKGDLSIPQFNTMQVLDRYTESSYTRFEVWHNAAVAHNIIAVGFVAPLLMVARVSDA